MKSITYKLIVKYILSQILKFDASGMNIIELLGLSTNLSLNALNHWAISHDDRNANHLKQSAIYK